MYVFSGGLKVWIP